MIDDSQNFQRIVNSSRYENFIIDHYHSFNHLDARATQRIVESRYVFEAMRQKISNLVRSYKACQESKAYRHVVSLISSIKMLAPHFATIHADLCGPFPKCKNFHNHWFSLTGSLALFQLILYVISKENL